LATVSTTAPAREVVVGRAHELAAIDDFLQALAERGSALLLAGEAGMGKTVLVRSALDRGRALGYRVLACAVVETESTYAFAGLIDLFSGMTDEELTQLLEPPLLEGLQRALFRSARGRSPSEQVVGLAALTVIRRLSVLTPVVLAVDDMHWLDTPSARVLGYVVRRLHDARVGFIVSLRIGEASSIDLDRLLAETGGARIELSGLSTAGLARLLEGRLGTKPYRSTLVRIARATGGNPLYALEVARFLAPDADPVHPLPVPSSLRDIVAHRLRALPSSAAQATLASFALARPTREMVAAVCGSAEGLLMAVDTGVLEVQGANVSLAHPLVGSILYSELRDADRQQLHRRLATVAPSEEERVRHLALGADGPSAEIADGLERAATAARDRGAPTGAAELLEIAVRLTPGEDFEARARRELALALDEFVCGQGASARARCRNVLAGVPPGRWRAAALCMRAELYDAAGMEEMQALLDQAFTEAEGDTELEARIHIALARLEWWKARPRDSELHARAAVELAERCGDEGLLAAALAHMALVNFFLGRNSAQPLFDRALALEKRLEVRLPAERPSHLYANMQMEARDDIDFARSCLERARASASSWGDEYMVAVLTLYQCELECWAGRFDEAERLAMEGADLLTQAESSNHEGYLLYTLALVDFWRGRTDAARARAVGALEFDERTGAVTFGALPRSLLGFIELSRGEPAAAAAWLDPLHDQYRAGGMVEPGVYSFLPDLVEALVAVGRLDRAAAVLDPFERHATRLGRSFAVGTAARCRALLLAAEGELDGAAAAAARSVVTLQASRQPFELARSLLVLGSVERRRRRKSKAAQALREANALLDELGAALWADRARSELGRVGLRPAAPAKLTATERRVAELAAVGHSNDEIAGLASISVKTVEANLTRVYRKLGVRSRHQLGSRLAD
jgi:DNA-binding CsgD family transcriptional regulator